ncbi:MAG: SMI1/KNR4 family protein, partial [Pseudomonadota bacterium]
RIFGEDGTGGYAAFWLVRDSEDVLEQPIVFLGSEGARGVVACSFNDYLWLLAVGVGPMEAVEYGPSPTKVGDKFVSFAKLHSGAPEVSPEEVVQRANEEFPDFPTWIDSLCR